MEKKGLAELFIKQEGGAIFKIATEKILRLIMLMKIRLKQKFNKRRKERKP